jgi:hypothetical protein
MAVRLGRHRLGARITDERGEAAAEPPFREFV